jgi:replicative DNA helicase
MANTKYDNGNKKRTSIDLSTMVYGKVPPQAKDLENAVLGSIMLEKNAFDPVSELLTAECFYVDAHQRIFKAMTSLSKKGQPIDILTVMQELKAMEELEMVGGAYYITQLTNSVVSSANNDTYCRILYEKYILREVIRMSGENISAAYDDTTDAFDLLAHHEKEFTALTTRNVKTYVTMDDALVTGIKQIESLRANPQHLTGIPSDLVELDRITHGWQNTDLIILAARPGVGKTAFALQIARAAALNRYRPVPVAFFSLEMSTGQLTQRNISAESEIFLDQIRSGNIDDEQMRHIHNAAANKMSKARIFFDDRAALTIFEFRAACRRFKRLWAKLYGTDEGLIIADYIQLFSGSGEKGMNREREISEVSRGMKQVAKELNLPVIALSQLNRATETRKGEQKMPQLSDLRESGAIEQDADMVMFLYRPEYYDITANEMGESNAGETHLKIAKHRNGTLETVKLTAKLNIQKFFPYEGGFPAAPSQGAFRPVSLPYKDNNDLPF